MLQITGDRTLLFTGDTRRLNGSEAAPPERQVAAAPPPSAPVPAPPPNAPSAATSPSPRPAALEGGHQSLGAMALPAQPVAALARQSAAVPESKAANSAPPAREGRAGYGVQLGAYPSNEEADRGWRELKDARPDLFAGLRPLIKDSPGESGGRVARLMIGPFENEGSAVELCGRFRAAGQVCSVRRMP